MGEDSEEELVTLSEPRPYEKHTKKERSRNWNSKFAFLCIFLYEIYFLLAHFY